MCDELGFTISLQVVISESMRRSLFRSLLTAAIWAASLCTLSAQEYSYMGQLSVDEGLPHTDVSPIVQDEDGYIWIGTYSGLCRITKTNFKLIPKKYEKDSFFRRNLQRRNSRFL